LALTQIRSNGRTGFNESLHRWQAWFTGGGDSGRVQLADVHPMPPAPIHGDSLEGWILTAVILAVIVASGLVLSSRR
jgi:hypothetical protein